MVLLWLQPILLEGILSLISIKNNLTAKGAKINFTLRIETQSSQSQTNTKLCKLVFL